MGAAPNDHRLFEGNDMTTPNIEELPAPETLAQMAEACETLTSLMLIIPGIDTGAWAKTLREADASMQSQAERIKELNLQVVSAFGQAQEALEERDTARATIEQLVGALEEWERVDVLGREPHIHRESWKQFVQDRNTKHTAAIAAGQKFIKESGK